MENQITPREFAYKIFAIASGLIILSLLASYLLNFSFGILSFGSGMLVSGLSSFLSGADTTNIKSPLNQKLIMNNWYQNDLLQRFADQALYNVTKAAPKYSIENAMLYAGMIVLAVSFPFLCQIMLA